MEGVSMSEPDSEHDCGGCRFWHIRGEAEFAECRRRAPVAQLGWFSRALGDLAPGIEYDLGNEARWPTTHHEAWCGDWEALP